MAKSTVATNWEIITRTEDGAMVNIDFDCPYCGESTGVFISVGANGVDCLDGSWETDQECPVCDKNITIKCY